MADQRDGGIAWTEQTWNPIRGCSRVSEGCRHCYAETVAARFSGPGQPYHGLAMATPSGPRWTGEVRLVEEHLADPLRWKRPRMVFVNSMSDLFHEKLTNEQIAAVFGVMAAAPTHTFQVLTKRAARLPDWFAWIERRAHDEENDPEKECMNLAHDVLEPRGEWIPPKRAFDLRPKWPLPNVWLGVSVEDQKTADERIPMLLETPAAIRWVSYEPALGRVNFDDGEHSWLSCGKPLHAAELATAEVPCCRLFPELGEHFRGIDWIVVGGESGVGARPFDVAWAISTVAQCRRAGVAVFVKQLGANIHDRNDVGFEAENEVHADGPREGLPTNRRAWPTPVDVEHDPNGWREEYQGAPVRVHLRDKKGGDMAEWPEVLRVREFPKTEAPARA